MVKASVNGKMALVTGSTSGIGYAIAYALLDEGYHVILNGRDAEKGQQVLNKFKQQFEHVDMLIADVATPAGIQSLQSYIQEHDLAFDLVVSNVGSGRCSNELTVSMDEYQRVFDTNFFSAVNVCQSTIGNINRGGAIIIISSIAGVAPIGAPIPYACAKAALNMLVQEWAMRTAKDGIRVNGISPGNVMFPGSTWDKKMQENADKTKQYIADNVPLNTFVEPDDIADMVCQIARSKSMTGQNIVLDGGQTLGRS